MLLLAIVQLLKGVSRLGELLENGYTGHMKPWHSHAYKMHTAVSADACKASVSLTDEPEKDVDVYQAEVLQSNGCRAFISPIFATTD